ncbi:MAG: hypothetical protein R3D90_03900 [Paracoccaceae bacterium]
MPFDEAQSYFNKEGRADEIEVMVAEPERVDDLGRALAAGGGPEAMPDMARQRRGLSAGAGCGGQHHVHHPVHPCADRVNEHHFRADHAGEERAATSASWWTAGLTEGAVLRVFFTCAGAWTGLVGTALGVVLGCSVWLYIDPIFPS